MIDRRRVPRYSVVAEERARDLRKQLTMGETLLWNRLRGRAMKGYDFHRQKPIGDYIVDFFCARLMLAIEIDGSSHRDKATEDAQRQRWLEGLGIIFLRFTEADVRHDMRFVEGAILRWIEEEEAGEGGSDGSSESGSKRGGK